MAAGAAPETPGGVAASETATPSFWVWPRSGIVCALTLSRRADVRRHCHGIAVLYRKSAKTHSLWRLLKKGKSQQIHTLSSSPAKNYLRGIIAVVLAKD